MRGQRSVTVMGWLYNDIIHVLHIKYCIIYSDSSVLKGEIENCSG